MTRVAEFLFPDCGPSPLGFYPIVDSVAWLERLLPLGVTTAQLRNKNLRGKELENEIRAAVACGKKYNCRLFINDYWELAAKHGAYGVHVGQEDLDAADLPAIAAAGLRLGISTHDLAEVRRARAIQPSYYAIGPISETTLKKMKAAPQGVEAIREWRAAGAAPLVAIGGITLEHAPEIRAAGVDGIAVVSDITQNAAPESRARAWLELFA